MLSTKGLLLVVALYHNVAELAHDQIRRQILKNELQTSFGLTRRSHPSSTGCHLNDLGNRTVQ
ncbi:hypothetical protein GUITHDRAFT_149955 [Guillardia theta CCMP2712]|uniref:Secreted protein n=1 Tax=Guillardia theta (strain CCMP2712) TaxID=905079 RepID=L1K3Q0_GUITC|nr:hypothetical protein GUITHDRAFT_149955 [Guillardia theta CCMP2712]EKX55095.1 hypothetical protein GUITHDRAFT_149955 [Guillardia theta CCMP2712]|eukprot:XP_005842075.1 hypothetical protein GUITHDRAFT_149955 [Guillardia theta CCMP2712]